MEFLRKGEPVNARLLIKLVFVLAVLLFMVMMGMSNHHPTRFKLDKFGWDFETQAAIMYFIFFGVGLITGAVIAVGGGGGKHSAPKGK